MKLAPLYTDEMVPNGNKYNQYTQCIFNTNGGAIMIVIQLPRSELPRSENIFLLHKKVKPTQPLQQQVFNLRNNFF